MSEILKQRIALMINNTVRIICFAILAVIFDHWWISLFSAFFLSYTIKEKEKSDA